VQLKARRRGSRGRRRGRRAHASPALRALTSGALALPGVAAADAPAQGVEASYAFSYYAEDSLPRSRVGPGAETDRYDVEMHQLRALVPVGGRADVALDLTHEAMSGATPWYVIPDADGDPIQVMTGATVEDRRTDALVTGTWYFDAAQASLAGGVSVENDYLAFNGRLGGDLHLGEKTTTLSGGAGFSVDRIEPTDADLFPLRPEREDKHSVSLFAGIARVINHNAALQSTLTWQRSAGFLSDPYKQSLVAGTPVADSRPDTRNQIAWLSRYRHHLSRLNGTLHADYRLAVDDWKVTAHTLELAWHQSLWDALRLVPSFRYYTQSAADFYAPFYQEPRSDGHYASDYRLSPYGAISWGLRAETAFDTWNVRWRATLSWERYLSDADYALGKVSVENPGLVNYHLLSIGLTARF
jgi:hypothetical protein